MADLVSTTTEPAPPTTAAVPVSPPTAAAAPGKKALWIKVALIVLAVVVLIIVIYVIVTSFTKKDPAAAAAPVTNVPPVSNISLPPTVPQSSAGPASNSSPPAIPNYMPPPTSTPPAINAPAPQPTPPPPISAPAPQPTPPPPISAPEPLPPPPPAPVAPISAPEPPAPPPPPAPVAPDPIQAPIQAPITPPTPEPPAPAIDQGPPIVPSNKVLTELIYDISQVASVRLASNFAAMAMNSGDPVAIILPVSGDPLPEHALRVQPKGNPTPWLTIAPDGGRRAARTRAMWQPQNTFPYYELPKTPFFSEHSMNNKTIAIVFATPYPLSESATGDVEGIPRWRDLLTFPGAQGLSILNDGGENQLIFNVDTRHSRLPGVFAHSDKRHVLCFTLFEQSMIRYCSNMTSPMVAKELVVVEPDWKPFNRSTLMGTRILSEYPGELCEFRVYQREFDANSLVSMCQDLHYKWSDA